jgi:hypothetical protein
MVVMLENQSYPAIVGPNSKTPYQNDYLATHCGLATQMFAATHWSAANYLALTGGKYPPGSPPGCGSVTGGCRSTDSSLFSQLDAAGLGWRNYVESMPYPCDPKSSGLYKIGHNPAIFYPLGSCVANDVPVRALASPGGPLWTALIRQTLPAFSFVSPNVINDGDESDAATADAWLQRFLGLVSRTPAYQSGSLAIVVTYDEGTGKDAKAGQDCTDQPKDLAGLQPSCHIAAFVVYPWAHGTDSTFFTHYSVTRMVEDLFGLPPLFNAGSANTMVGHLGL